MFEPIEINRKALARQHADHLMDRQPNDRTIRADDPVHERPGNPLDRIAAGLALPFTRGDVAVDFF